MVKDGQSLAIAAGVQEQVSNAESCTAQTIASLESILSEGSDKPARTATPSNNADPSNKPVPGPRKTAQSEKREPATGQPTPVLSFTPSEKVTIATGIINTLLRSLSNVQKPVIRNTSTKDGARRGSSSSPTSSATERKVLQPINGNRSRPAPGRGQCSAQQRAKSAAEKQVDGVRAQAHCARIAFSFLRGARTQSQPEPKAPSLQLEAGMSALISKFLSLGLHDLAIPELRILHARLNDNLKPEVGKKEPSGPPDACGTNRNAKDAAAVNIQSLLQFPPISRDNPLLNLVVTTQLQILRLITASQCPDIERLCNYLMSDSQTTPAKLILLQMTKGDKMAVDKIAQQLETLAQLVLKICGKGYTNLQASPSKNHEEADSVFRLQLLCHEYRKQWWDLTDHKPDVVSEILSPFLQQLRQFCKLSPTSERQQYETCFQAFRTVCATIADETNAAPKMMDIFKALAESARRAGMPKEELNWLERAFAASKEAGTTIERANIACQLCSLCLQPSLSDMLGENCDKAIVTAHGCLLGDLTGESSALKELLLQLGKVCKQISSQFLKTLQAPTHGGCEESITLSQAMTDFMQLALRIFRRCCTSQSDGITQGQTSGSCVRDSQLIQRLLHGLTDDLCKIIGTAPGQWRSLKPVLDSIMDIISCQDSIDDQSTDELPSDRQGSIALLISQAYLIRYSNARKKGASVDDLLQLLHSSLDILTRKNIKRLIPAFLVRYEHLAQLHEKVRNYPEALAFHKKGLDLLLDTGVIQRASDHSSRVAFTNVLNENDDFKVLARLLEGFTRTGIVAQEFSSSKEADVIFFNHEALRNDHRVFLWSHQFCYLISLSHEHRPSPSQNETILYARDCLSRQCASENFPIRRLHLDMRLASLQSSYGTGITSLSKTETAAVTSDELLNVLESSDKALARFGPHLASCMRLLGSLTESTVDLRFLEEILGDWHRLALGCHSSSSVRDHVFDVDAWQDVLHILETYLEVHDKGILRCLTLQIRKRLEDILYSDVAGFLSTTSLRLCQSLATLGYPGIGKACLEDYERNLDLGSCTAEMAMNWHFTNAIVEFEDGKHEECKQYMELLPEEHGNRKSADITNASIDGKLATKQSSADRAFLRSRLAAAKGQLHEAMLSARLAVKGYYSIWHYYQRSTESSMSDQPTVFAVGSSTSAQSAVVLSKHGLPYEEKGNGFTPPFWSLAISLFQGLQHLGRLNAFCGLGKDAEYYLEQSGNISNAVGLPALSFGYLTFATEIYRRCGKMEEASQACRKLSEFMLGPSTTKNELILHLTLMSLTVYSERTEQRGKRWQDLRDCLKVLRQEKRLKCFGRSFDPTSLVSSMEDLSLNGTNKPPTKNDIVRRGRRKPALNSSKAKSEGVDMSELSVSQAYPIHVTGGCIDRAESLAELYGSNLESSQKLLQEADRKPADPQGQAKQTLALAELSLRKVIANLEKHPVLNAVNESVLAGDPFVSIENDTSKEEATVKVTKRPNSGSGKAQSTSKVGKRHLHTKEPEFSTEISSVSEQLKGVLQNSGQLMMLPDFHHYLDCLARSSAMATCTAYPRSASCGTADSLIMSRVGGRNLAMLRERIAIDVDRQFAQGNDSSFKSMTDSVHAHPTSSMESTDWTGSCTEFTNMIPSSWNVICVGLNSHGNELYLTNIRKNRSPLALKLPMKRQGAIECEDDGLTFGEAKHELTTIIELANESSQKSKNVTSKQEKAEWWETRRSLDMRLKDLLTQIEEGWLGGFRGVFAHGSPDEAVLEQFGSTLEQLLNQHLPSRRSSPRSPNSKRLSISPRVLELFVQLHCPSEENDLDDHILDLIYFLVDMLQFNGERNAYDEIDFDSLVIKTTEALCHYHQALEQRAPERARTHTVLILDKKLNAFPWECLPCLKNQSVSRLPSLNCLWSRLKKGRSTQAGAKAGWSSDVTISIPRNNGAYILNPAGDLVQTQSQFEETLESLPGWHGLVEKKPQEDEVKSMLESQDLFLYFGHGSGGQYIRPRIIKKLQKCAVALLIGCSSGALTEAGDFEPYGTPINYMHAGCPALVANLWDVTDKDIDRFSQSVLEKWGLFKEPSPVTPAVQASPVKKGSRRNGKGKAQEAAVEPTSHPKEARQLSLTEAVAQSRDTCILQYLNGAAPVVFGIPVMIE